MKKIEKRFKKGFTLIELLAIIVILAVIAVITVPIILNVIENSKKGAATDSAYGYKDAIQKYYTTQLTTNNGFKLDGEYTIANTGSIYDDIDTHDITVSGTIPRGGHVTLENGTVTAGCIQINEYAVTITDKKVTSTIKGTCDGISLVEAYPQVTDSNPGIICGDGQTEDYDNSSVCYIYSVEDLVAFSAMVNSGKNFSSKTVMLMNNLDIANDASYANANSNQFNDLNEDGTTSSTLKEELTKETGKGFNPIGNYTNKFSGIFEGNVHTLNNLYINRNTTDYVGLFGYNTGTIKGLKTTNSNITGKNFTGIIAGYNKGNITSTIVDGDVTGNSYIGLLTGENYAGTIETIVSGNVTSAGGIAGGIVGEHGYLGEIKAIYKSGSVSSSSSSINRAYGTYNYNNPGTLRLGALSTIQVKGNTRTSVSLNGADGYDIPENGINNIAMLEFFVDTYVGGDDNNDGYYYDYDSTGNVTIYSKVDHPLEITMAGSGTQEDPYIINNYNELKQVSYNLGTKGSGKYYKLNADINLVNKNSIMLGSGEDSNAYSEKRFTSVFDGNGHTISNLNLVGCNYVGLFGYNVGTIRGLKIANANISGYSFIGIFSGYNKGNITGTMADGSVSGNSYIGLLTGENYAGTIETIVSGNVSSTGERAGGIVGEHGYLGEIKAIYKSGSVSSTSSSSINRVYGFYNYNNPGTLRLGALSTIQVKGDTRTSVSLTGADGYSIPENGINNIAMLEFFVDTYVGGDNNNDGYYYDYDSTGNITVYSKVDHPLEITMSGSGTQEDPYIINNYDELKQVSYNLGTKGSGKYYRLDADINMQGKNPIMLGSGEDSNAYSEKRFTSVFDGNTHTISNLNLVGCNYAGLFGYNVGTIKGLRLSNVNVTGYNYVGIFSGYNKGSIISTMADGNASGNAHIGLASGENYTGTIETIVSGNVTSTGEIAGGIVGEHGYIGTLRAIYKSGSVSSTSSSSINRAYGTYNYNNPGTVALGALDTIQVRGSTRTSTSKKSADGKSFTAAELQTLTPYEDVGLNTSSTSGEYRYALDSNNNPYIVKN